MTATLKLLGRVTNQIFESQMQHAAKKISERQPRALRRRSGREPLRSKLPCKPFETLDSKIDRNAWRGFAASWSVLGRPREVGGAKPERGGGGKIVGMRRHHHAGFRLEIEGLGRSEIDARLRLIVAGDFSPQNGVPRKPIAPSKVDHQ